MIVESKVVINNAQFKIIETLGERAIKEIGDALNVVGMERVTMIKQKLNGPVLKRDTGFLINSIGWKQHGAGLNKAIEYGAIMHAVKYAAIHEFGGKIPDRRPVKGKALIIPIKGAKIKVRSGLRGGSNLAKVLKGGKWGKGMAGRDFIFRKFARGFTMPKRSYLLSTAKDHQARTERIMAQAMKRVAGA